MPSDDRAAAPEPWSSRLGLIALELALLGFAWWYMTLDWVLVAVFAAVIVATGLLPERWRMLGSGAGFLAMGGLLHFHYGNTRLGGVLAMFGVVLTGAGLFRLFRKS